MKPDNHKLDVICQQIAISHRQGTELFRKIRRAVEEGGEVIVQNFGTFYRQDNRETSRTLNGVVHTVPENSRVRLRGDKVERRAVTVTALRQSVRIDPGDLDGSFGSFAGETFSRRMVISDSEGVQLIRPATSTVPEGLQIRTESFSRLEVLADPMPGLNELTVVVSQQLPNELFPGQAAEAGPVVRMAGVDLTIGIQESITTEPGEYQIETLPGLDLLSGNDRRLFYTFSWINLDENLQDDPLLLVFF